MGQNAFQILIVEDNPGDAKLVEEMLHAAGEPFSNTRCVCSCAEAQKEIAGYLQGPGVGGR